MMDDAKIKYVLGFAFDNQKNLIVVQKTKPDWQRGLINGIGGHIEFQDKTPKLAMVREFQEETSIITTEDQWKYVVTLSDDLWEVDVFSCHDLKIDFKKFDGNETDTDEIIKVIKPQEVIDNPDFISNIGWLVGMCFDSQMPVEYNIINKEKKK